MCVGEGRIEEWETEVEEREGWVVREGGWVGGGGVFFFEQKAAYGILV